MPTEIQKSDEYLSFKLSNEFVDTYRDKKVQWGLKDAGGTSFSEIVFLRTYSRKKEDGTKETWQDVSRRIVEGTFSIQKDWAKKNILPWSDVKAQKSAQEMYDRIFTFRMTPGGRGIQNAGTHMVNGLGYSTSLLNCAAVSTSSMTRWDPAKPFQFLMSISMMGVGVGYDTRGSEKNFKINKPSPEYWTYEVPDTREGWAESIKHLIESYLIPGKKTVVFDYSIIRPKGALIKSFGTQAPGPEPLRKLHNTLRRIYNERDGQLFGTIEICDTANLIGKCVVSGNTRRCLPEGTRVKTIRGSIKIEDLQVGDVIVTAAGTAPIEAVMDQGKQDTIFINHEYGTLECTPNHQVAVFTSLDEWKFKLAKDLTTEDHLVWDSEVTPGIDIEMPIHNAITRLPVTEGSYRGSHKKSKPARHPNVICSVEGCEEGSVAKTPVAYCNTHYLRNKNYGNPLYVKARRQQITVPELDVNSAWLVGLVLGDGYKNIRNTAQEGRAFTEQHGSLRVACSLEYPEIIDRAVAELGRYGVNAKAKQRSAEKMVDVCAVSIELARYAQDHFKNANTIISVPDWIYEASPEIRCAFLAGVFDSDGSSKTRPICLVTSIYEDFVDQLQSVYASLGIPSYKRQVRNSNSPKLGQEKWQSMWQLILLEL